MVLMPGCPCCGTGACVCVECIRTDQSGWVMADAWAQPFFTSKQIWSTNGTAIAPPNVFNIGTQPVGTTPPSDWWVNTTANECASFWSGYGTRFSGVYVAIDFGVWVVWPRSLPGKALLYARMTTDNGGGGLKPLWAADYEKEINTCPYTSKAGLVFLSSDIVRSGAYPQPQFSNPAISKVGELKLGICSQRLEWSAEFSGAPSSTAAYPSSESCLLIEIAMSISSPERIRVWITGAGLPNIELYTGTGVPSVSKCIKKPAGYTSVNIDTRNAAGSAGVVEIFNGLCDCNPLP